jgi:hypothetical protein
VARGLIIAGSVLLVLGITLGGYQVYLRYQDAVQARQVDSYTAGILQPAQQAGALVGQTIVPELDGYAKGTTPAPKVALDATGWQLFFGRTRAAFARVAHPGSLGPIAQQFDKALGEYELAVADFRLLASTKSTAAEAAGRAEARRGDCDYAQAASSLAALRRSLGLPDVKAFDLNVCK